MNIDLLIDFASVVAFLLIPVSILIAGKRIATELKQQRYIFKGIEARLKGLEDITATIEKEVRLTGKRS
ncbi:hypothetical protein KAR28_06755 [Candidatus Parcubacteria bacterium]|nr:hypothetical protein [Candidatus Parcubacteria bacterium]